MTIRERLTIWVAWLLPRDLAYWVFVRVQTANYGENPADRPAIESMKSWRQNAKAKAPNEKPGKSD